MKKGLILLSGGMDSTCLLYEHQAGIGLALCFDYGSKHNDREFTYAAKSCEKFGIELIRVDLKPFFQHFKSDLLQSGGAIPEGHYADDSMKKTIVPFRNGIMLSIAVGIAESRGMTRVLIANHFGDHAVYPDCRKSFIEPFAQAVVHGTQEGIVIHAPYTSLTKKEIGERGLLYEVPFSQTYSCYNGGPLHCGKCGTCVERKEALYGYDPTIYMDIETKLPTN